MSKNINPEMDGIDHINVYSKGKTDLGRFLTNFSESKIETEDGQFMSIEGYWYWLSCKDDALRGLSGYQAKARGREMGGKDWLSSIEFKTKILKAIDIKLENNPDYLNALKNLKLPLKHYYVYGNKIIEPKDGSWILNHLESFKNI